MRCFIAAAATATDAKLQNFCLFVSEGWKIVNTIRRLKGEGGLSLTSELGSKFYCQNIELKCFSQENRSLFVDEGGSSTKKTTIFRLSCIHRNASNIVTTTSCFTATTTSCVTTTTATTTSCVTATPATATSASKNFQFRED